MSIYVKSEVPLLPCPFCGAAGDDILLEKDNYEDAADYVVCSHCSCQGPYREGNRRPYPIAILNGAGRTAEALWNTRTPVNITQNSQNSP
jgi:hypothetical protein